jgi:hypothetical protein
MQWSSFHLAFVLAPCSLTGPTTKLENQLFAMLSLSAFSICFSHSLLDSAFGVELATFKSKD